MFIFWKTRPHDRGGTNALCAQLCASERLKDHSQPRRVVLAHLGTIDNEFVFQPRRREKFWLKVREKLNTVDLPDGERVQIEAMIAQRVPLPEMGLLVNPRAQEHARRLHEVMRELAHPNAA